MSKYTLVAAVLVLAACGEKKSETPAADTAAVVAPAPVAPPTDSVRHDSMPADTTKH